MGDVIYKSQENLTPFQRQTASLGRFKTEEKVDPISLSRKLRENGYHLNIQQWNDVMNVLEDNPKEIDTLFSELKIKDNRDSVTYRLASPLTEEENEKWEQDYVNKTVTALREAGSFREEAKQIATEVTSAYGEGFQQTGLGILVGGEALFRGLFKKGTRSKAQLDYLSGALAKSEAIADEVAKLSGGDKVKYHVATTVGVLTPMLLTAITGQALGVSGYTATSQAVGRGSITAYTTTAAIGAVQPGTDMFSAEGVKTLIHAGVAVAAMRSGLTSAKITKGMPFLKAYMIDNAINVGVDVGTIAVDLVLEGELGYNPVDMLTTSFFSNATFFGIGRVGGRAKAIRLNKILTDDAFRARQLRGEAPEKSSQRLKLFALDVLSEVDVDNATKVKTLDNALKSGVITPSDKAELVSVYNRLKDEKAFSSFKSDIAEAFKESREAVKEFEMSEWKHYTNVSTDDNIKLKDVEGGEEYAERVGKEIVEGDSERPSQAEVVSPEEEGIRIRNNEEIRLEAEKVTEAETNLRPDKINLNDHETVKDAVIRLALDGWKSDEIKYKLAREGMDTETEGLDRYIESVRKYHDTIAEKSQPANMYSEDLAPAKRKMAIGEMTKKDASEIKALREEAKRLGLPLGAAAAGFTKVDPQKIKSQLVSWLKQNVSLKNRGKMIDAIEKAKTTDDLRVAIERASAYEEEFMKAMAIAEFKSMKKKAARAHKMGKIVPDVWQKITNILDAFDPVKMREETKKKTYEKAVKSVEELLGKSVYDLFEALNEHPEVGGIFSSQDLKNIMRMNRKPLADMTASEVKDIVDSLKHLYTASLEAYTIEWQGKRISKAEFHNSVVEQMRETRVNPLVKKLADNKLFSMFVHNDVFALLTGSEAFKKVFDSAIVKGEEKRYDIYFNAIDIFKSSDIPSRFRDGIEGFAIDKFLSFKIGGSPMRVTEDELLKIYFLAKDPDGLRHLIGGKDSGLDTDGKIEKITKQEIADIVKHVEGDDELLSVVAAWKKTSDYVYKEFNEAHLKQTGVELDKADFYTQILVSDKFAPTGKPQEMDTSGRMKGSAYQRSSGTPSTAKSRTRSTAPVKLEGLLTSGHRSIDISSKYAGLAEPTKVAYGALMDNGIAQEIKSKFGETVYKRMVGAIQDDMGFNYNPDEMNRIMNNVLGNIAVGTLAFNVFSSIKTRTSLLAALPIIEAKYWFAGMGSREDIRKHSLLRLRSEGRISPEIAMAMQKRFGRGEYGANMRRMMKTGMSFIANGDEWVVRNIYGMMTAKVDAEYPELKGIERHKKIGELTYDVVRKSQPTFMTHDRPSARRGSGWTRAAFPFSSQRMQNYNVLLRAIIDYEQGGRTFNGAVKLTETSALVWIVQSLLVAGINELRNELMAGGKRTSKERMKGFFVGTANTFFGNMPLLDVPSEAIISELFDAKQFGVGYENIVLETVNAIIGRAPKIVLQTVKVATSDMSEREKKRYIQRIGKNTRYLSTNVFKILGLPKVGFDYIRMIENFTNPKLVKENEERLKKQMRKERAEERRRD